MLYSLVRPLGRNSSGSGNGGRIFERGTFLLLLGDFQRSRDGTYSSAYVCRDIRFDDGFRSFRRLIGVGSSFVKKSLSSLASRPFVEPVSECDG